MTERCDKCGGYLPDRPFYFLSRPPLGTLYVWVCPNCGEKVEKWVSDR